MKKETSALLTFYLVVLIIIVWLSGCSAAKDNRAFKRVLSNPELADRTFKQLERTRPCTNDTVIFVDGKEVIRYDTVLSKEYNTDTTILNDTVYITKTKPVYITKYIYRTDTVKSVVTDTRRLQLAYDDNNTLKGANDVLTKSVKEERERGNRFLYWLIGIVSLLVLGTAYKVYRKFKII